MILASSQRRRQTANNETQIYPVPGNITRKKKTAKPTCTRTFLLRLLLDVHGRLNPDRLKRVPALPALDTSPPAGRGKAKKINNKTSQAVDGCCCYHTLYTSACHQLFQPELFEVLLLRFSLFRFLRELGLTLNQLCTHHQPPKFREASSRQLIINSSILRFSFHSE